jgi:Apea-like HEPN
VSNEIQDAPYIRLLHDTFDFANDTLARLKAFNRDRVHEQVTGLWRGLSAGIEMAEVGALVYRLISPSDVDIIPVSQTGELHSATGRWLSERFKSPDELPKNSWVLSVTHARSSAPDVRMLDQWAHAQQVRDEQQLDVALLPLRLVRPTDFHLGTTYRLGIQGYRNPPRRSWFEGPEWSDENSVALSKDVFKHLRILGELLSGKGSPSLDQGEGRSVTELSLRTFSSAFTRPQWADSVVDLAVVLEALFAGDAREEITYRVSFRAALLIGRGLEESTRVLRAVRAFYALRSGVVHAGTDLDRVIRRVWREWTAMTSPPCAVLKRSSMWVRS